MSSARSRRAELIGALDTEIRRVSAQSTLLSHAVAARLGINGTDLECLDILHLGGAATAGQLAAATGLTTGAITGVLDRLEAAGFARRERDPGDRRRVIVRVLSAAERRIQPLYRSLQQKIMELWSNYDEHEIALILDFLRRTYPALRDETAKLRAPPAESVRVARSNSKQAPMAPKSRTGGRPKRRRARGRPPGPG